MKNTLLMALLSTVVVVNANVNANEYDDGFWFPNETLSEVADQLAPTTQLAQSDVVPTGEAFDKSATVFVSENEVNNAKRLKFTSRRAAQNPAVQNKDAYSGDDEWVGATYIDEKEDKAGKRLNRQFRSKRPHINYQFD